MNILLSFMLAVSSWIAPQPQHSKGLIVIYGSDRLVSANARWHSYSLDGYAFGLASISPQHLGTIAWVRTNGKWYGPGLIVDVVARGDAFGSIFERHEIAEVSYATAHLLGFDNGGMAGEIFFGVCPPPLDSIASPYAPPLVFDYPPYDKTPSFYPYPAQVFPVSCNHKIGYLSQR